MGLFSFFKREKQLKCDWCGEELETPAYTKYINKVLGNQAREEMFIGLALLVC